MRDIWFLIYFCLMGIVGLFFYGLMFAGLALYYPIWKLTHLNENKDT